MTSPGSGKPVISRGTGWLIGRRHVITNHHVINARSEPVAAEPDLRLQATTARIQFDFDYEGAPEN